MSILSLPKPPTPASTLQSAERSATRLSQNLRQGVGPAKRVEPVLAKKLAFKISPIVSSPSRDLHNRTEIAGRDASHILTKTGDDVQTQIKRSGGDISWNLKKAGRDTSDQWNRPETKAVRKGAAVALSAIGRAILSGGTGPGHSPPSQTGDNPGAGEPSPSPSPSPKDGSEDDQGSETISVGGAY